MDSDLILSHFDEIEEKVDLLIELCKTLESSNTDLNEKIQQLEQELQNKITAEGSYSEQKSKIRVKVDSLLSRLNHIDDLIK